MINPQHFVDLVIKPSLEDFLGDKYASKAAVKLLLGTALQESKLTHLKQIGGGPALGVYQMEPVTHNDIWETYLRYDSYLFGVIGGTSSGSKIEYPHCSELITDMKYATLMARMHYYRVSDPLPDFYDDVGLAHYWKDHYNTSHGAGTVDEYLDCWAQFGHEVKI